MKHYHNGNSSIYNNFIMIIINIVIMELLLKGAYQAVLVNNIICGDYVFSENV